MGRVVHFSLEDGQVLRQVRPLVLPQAAHEVELEDGLLISALVLQPIDDLLEVRIGLFEELLALLQTEQPEVLTA